MRARPRSAPMPLRCSALPPALVIRISTSQSIGFNTVWTPVKNLAFTVDVSGALSTRSHSGLIASPGLAAAAKPAAVYELKDQDFGHMLIRAQRNF